MIVLITLTTAGSNTEPFNIYSNADGFTSAIVSGVSRDTLLAGYEITAPDETTIILVESVGTCERQLYLNVAGAPTTTTSTTSSTTTLIPPPTTSTLTFEDYQGGQFSFSLTDALSVPVVITYAGVNGSQVNNCGPYEESDDISGSPITIPAGMNYASGLGNSPMSCFVNSWKREASIVISGIGLVTNGQTVNIGGTIVTIIINTACVDYYAC